MDAMCSQLHAQAVLLPGQVFWEIFNRKLGRLNILIESGGEEKNVCRCLEPNPVIQSLASHYT